MKRCVFILIYIILAKQRPGISHWSWEWFLEFVSQGNNNIFANTIITINGFILNILVGVWNVRSFDKTSKFVSDKQIGTYFKIIIHTVLHTNYKGHGKNWGIRKIVQWKSLQKKLLFSTL